MDRYEKLEKNGPVETVKTTDIELGEGTYGYVYKAKDLHMDEYVAMKKIKLDLEEEGIPSTALREISILRELDHPNIVHLRDCVQNEGKLYLVFEFVDMDLRRYMDSFSEPLEKKVVKSFLYQMLHGLNYLHSNAIMHRDLKPQNLLVSNQGRIKIADFGLARKFIPPIRPLTHEVVTLWYRAPEILLGSQYYAPPIDVWACGCMMVEIITKSAPFQGECEIDQLYKIFQILGTPTEETWPQVSQLPDWNPAFPNWPKKSLMKAIPELESDVLALDILTKLLQLDPKDRISAKMCLHHQYFDDLDTQEIYSEN